MPFLDWFKKKSRSTEAEDQACGAGKLSSQPDVVTRTSAEERRHAGVAETTSTEQLFRPPAVPLSPTASSQQLPSAIAEPAPVPHFSVPVGAFYSKLPSHLLALETPDLTRSIEISEEDLVINKETREAVIPLSILSLSCPDIFVRPIGSSDEIPITFPIGQTVPMTVAEHPQETAAQTPESPTRALGSTSAATPAFPCPEVADIAAGALVNEPRISEIEPGGDSDETERVDRHPTVRATTASGKIAGLEFSGAADSAEREIKLRLEPILSSFPPDLEQPSIQALSNTSAEIFLPLDMIQSQLDRGRVVVSAAVFSRALPDDLRSHFDAIEPTAEIPIPLQEIFLSLPADAIKLREDQETDYPEGPIQTPFSIHAEEDAKRLGRVLDAATATGSPISGCDMEEPCAPKEAATSVPVSASDELPAEAGDRHIPHALSTHLRKFSAKLNSERLHAIFMTDEVLDLSKAIRKVAELPGLRACLLNTTDGLKLAGNLEDPSQEQAVSALLPELFQQARSKLANMQLGTLETITLHCGRNQLSTFLQGKYCLTVLHDNRPFKPGVREKVQAVMSELVTLGELENQP